MFHLAVCKGGEPIAMLPASLSGFNRRSEIARSTFSSAPALGSAHDRVVPRYRASTRSTTQPLGACSQTRSFWRLGGFPGFVRIAEDVRLTIPDFRGNRCFKHVGQYRGNKDALSQALLEPLRRGRSAL